MQRCGTVTSWCRCSRSSSPRTTPGATSCPPPLPPGSSPSKRVRSRRCACAARGSTGYTRCASDSIGRENSSGCRPSAGALPPAAPGALRSPRVARRAESAADDAASARTPAQKGGMRNAIQLDFAGRRPALSLAGGLLLAVGVVAAGAVSLEYRSIMQHRAGLELKLAALARADALAAAPVETPADTRMLVSVQQAATDLATPWTLLLAELEQASKETQGEVSLLGVEPR